MFRHIDNAVTRCIIIHYTKKLVLWFYVNHMPLPTVNPIKTGVESFLFCQKKKNILEQKSYASLVIMSTIFVLLAILISKNLFL